MVLSDKKIVLFLNVLIGMLFGIHLLLLIIKFCSGHDHVFGLIELFDLNGEHNIPTVFSFFLLFYAAVLLARIAFSAFHTGRPYPWHWAGLSAVFAWLSYDEMYEIHEQWITPIRDHFHADGIFYFIWQLPYLITGIVVVMFYVPFFKQLGEFRRRMFLAAVVYLFGVVVLESVEGFYFSQGGAQCLMCLLAESVEEALEMIGVVIFIDVLLQYIRSK